ncbi:hypothetical protein GCM10010991_32900 [Gemmobacter aquaticus]|uniref:Transposase DDE domain-containing protein n=1 Tax=Gemmobacter aquaticus TaxID=490185 RepID=A0A917YPW9_9RHOB|nr:hypothetical protein GCM10010991_32900 [Gemmobacter aquaticus]
MSKPTPARYRTTNWPNYTASLRERGSLLIWLNKEMLWLAPHDGGPGRPPAFPDAAIQFCLSIKVLFKLPLRQTTGVAASLLKMVGLDWTVPDYTTLYRRQLSALERHSSPTLTGLWKVIPSTAMVAERPRATLAARLPAARPICAISQPSNISPDGLVSAGMAMVRMTGYSAC